jgi:hypothetical protein
MRLLVGDTFSIVWRSCDTATEVPISSTGSPALRFSSETSRFSLEFSSARSAIRISRSALNGFSMKSKAPRLMAETAVSMLPWPDIITTGQYRGAGLDLVQQRQTVELAALHPDIEEDQPRGAVGNRCQRAVAVVRGAGLVALVGKNARDNLANVVFVIDDQNIRGHMHFPCHLQPRQRALFPGVASARGSWPLFPGQNQRVHHAVRAARHVLQ